MNRIDSHFIKLSLDEKIDPTERFIQALDEFDADGQFRKLLICHFSGNWQRVFSGISDVENALKSAKSLPDDENKCIAILLHNKDRLSFSLDYYRESLPDRTPFMYEFAIDIAKTFYPDSPYSFYSNGMKHITRKYSSFVSWIYGEDYCLSKPFFEDKALASLQENERNRILCAFFESVIPTIQNLDILRNKSESLLALTSLLDSEAIQKPIPKITAEFLHGMEFIKSWIKFDSREGRLPYDFGTFIYGTFWPWNDIKQLLCHSKDSENEVLNKLTRLLDGYQREFEELLYINADVSLLTEQQSEQWVRGIDSHVNFIPKDFDFSSSENDDELNVLWFKKHAEICSKLNQTQIETWMRKSVELDCQSIINATLRIDDFSNSSKKWIGKEYFETWKTIFSDIYDDLTIDDQLRIISARPPRGIECDAVNKKSSIFWDELFSVIIEKAGFPKELIPNWSIIASHRVDKETYLPHIDKSIGILRGELSRDGISEEKLDCYHKQLANLLPYLDMSLSDKGLRHRLLLMRSSKIAFSDKSISKKVNFLERNNILKWFDTLNQVAISQFSYQVNGRVDVTAENYSQKENDFYLHFSQEIAEFCLSRLRLRKGEKSNDGFYGSGQVIEQSAIWRQGYLKALTELGFDLNGKVHKTVNFIKKSDPDGGVRDIASECYKAVRRHGKHNPSVQDIKRGIVAAEWWLLISQRQELGLEVEYEEALKTRRTLMRNP
jgi:hypothetical protein